MSEVKKENGIILISVLWVIIVLSLLTLGLARMSSGAMALTQQSIGKLKAYAAARSGINYTVDLLARTRAPNETLYQTGIALNGKAAQDVFKEFDLGNNAFFSIEYRAFGFTNDGKAITAYGIQDEERLLNLNALDTNNISVLASLIQQFGQGESAAKEIAQAVLNWKINIKKKPFDRIEEVLLIDGITQELFDRIKHYVTVFPKEGGFKLNVVTAPRPLLQALVDWIDKSDGVVDQLVRRRDGPDGVPFTSDDSIALDQSDFVSEETGFKMIENLSSGPQSRFFKIRAVGVDRATQARCIIEAVVDTQVSEGLPNIVAWQRD